MLSGYRHPGYAAGMAEFGSLIELPRSGGWLLRRPIPGTSWHDAISPYPYLVCADWRALAADLDALEDDLVTVAAAPDPFGAYQFEDLASAFPSHLVPFKDHFVADLSVPEEAAVSRHHRAEALKALQRVNVEVTTSPIDHLDEWAALFALVVERFALRGMRAFSFAAFRHHLSLPGATMTRAVVGGETVAAHLQLQHDGVVYAHLAAHRPEARAFSTTYAMYLAERRYFTGRARVIDWGGVAGVSGNASGLSAFKQGWSTGTQPAWFAGRILNRDRYQQLADRVAAPTPGFFPAYRSGEFR